jgi:hypothetical protein
LVLSVELHCVTLVLVTGPDIPPTGNVEDTPKVKLVLLLTTNTSVTPSVALLPGTFEVPLQVSGKVPVFSTKY